MSFEICTAHFFQKSSNVDFTANYAWIRMKFEICVVIDPSKSKNSG